VPEYTVITTTRNRPVSLQKCLGRTRAVLPPEVRIIVFDDGSTNADQVRSIVEMHPNTTCLRSEGLVGPGEGRNRCLREARTPFCLSLDDDCHLHAVPDLSRWGANRPEDRDIAVVTFRCFDVALGFYAPEHHNPGSTMVFHGGASLLRREAVLRAGGYLDWLVFACEDTELALRLRRLQYRIWYDPSVTVQHDHSPEARDERWASFYYVRNTLLINVIHSGLLPGMPVGFLRALRRGFNISEPSQALPGILAGLGLVGRCLRARRELFAPERRCPHTQSGS
jgi:GT2 family glycosyltransferase